MPQTISLADLAIKLTEGHTFSPAQFHLPERSNENWCRQQLFALDFDEGLTLEQAIVRCRQYGIMPGFAYSTFSSVKDNKFRLVFVMGNEIEDARLRTIIQEALFQVFPEADQHCGDAGRMFFGGKDILHFDDKAKVEPPDLVFRMCWYLKENDKHGHFARSIKRFCKRVGLDLYKGLPKVLPEDHDGGDEESGSLGGRIQRSTCIYYRTWEITPVHIISSSPTAILMMAVLQSQSSGTQVPRGRKSGTSTLKNWKKGVSYIGTSQEERFGFIMQS